MYAPKWKASFVSISNCSVFLAAMFGDSLLQWALTAWGVKETKNMRSWQGES